MINLVTRKQIFLTFTATPALNEWYYRLCLWVSDSDSQDGYSSIHTVEFCRNGGPLGITIAGSEDPREPIYVSALTQDGLAERSQALQVGDQLLAIDSHSLAHEPLSSAIYLLQSSKDRVILCVGRNNNISVNSK